MTLSMKNLRQVVAWVATAFGVVTQAVSTLHLPVAVSSVLAAAGPVLLAIEHYVDLATPATGAAVSPQQGGTPAG